MEIRPLTPAETDIMSVLWKLEKASVKDILAMIPDPKPAYNTVATFLRILEKKKVISHDTQGNVHQYFPLLTEEQFKRHEVNQLMTHYFNNSLTNLVTFFVRDSDLREQDIEELKDLIRKNRDEK